MLKFYKNCHAIFIMIILGYATAVLAFYLFIRGLMGADVEFTRYYSHFLLFKKEANSDRVDKFETKQLDESFLKEKLCAFLVWPFV